MLRVMLLVAAGLVPTAATASFCRPRYQSMALGMTAARCLAPSLRACRCATRRTGTRTRRRGRCAWFRCRYRLNDFEKLPGCSHLQTAWQHAGLVARCAAVCSCRRLACMPWVHHSPCLRRILVCSASHLQRSPHGLPQPCQPTPAVFRAAHVHMQEAQAQGDEYQKKWGRAPVKRDGKDWTM